MIGVKIKLEFYLVIVFNGMKQYLFLRKDESSIRAGSRRNQLEIMD